MYGCLHAEALRNSSATTLQSLTSQQDNMFARPVTVFLSYRVVDSAVHMAVDGRFSTANADGKMAPKILSITILIIPNEN